MRIAETLSLGLVAILATQVGAQDTFGTFGTSPLVVVQSEGTPASHVTHGADQLPAADEKKEVAEVAKEEPQPIQPLEAPLLTRTLGAPRQPGVVATPAPAKGEVEEKGEKPKGYVINFNDVSVAEYIRFVAQITGSNFIYNEADLQFNVTIVSEEPTGVEYIMSALLQILETRGLQLAEQGNQLLIYRNAELAKLATVVSDEMAKAEDEAPIMTRVFQVRNSTPANLEKIVTPLLSERALVQISPDTGHLIVTDISGNVERVGDLLNTLDAPVSDIEIGEYHVQSTYIEALVELARKILKPLGGSSVTLVPQPMTDTIFIVGSPYMIQRTLSVLEALDAGPESSKEATVLPPYASSPTAGSSGSPTVPGFSGGPSMPGGASAPGLPPSGIPGLPSRGTIGEGTMAGISPFGPRKTQLDPTTFYIYKLQYHQGKEIKSALQDIADSLHASSGGSTDLISTISTVQWIQSSNSLVVSGTRASIEKIRELIQDLDVPLQQVFIEVLVLRTTIINSLRVGVEWGYSQSYIENGTEPNVVQSGFGSTQGSPGGTPSALNSRLIPTQQPAPLPPLAQGVELGLVGRFVSLDGQLFTSVGAIINALQDDRDTTIMFNPKVLCQDNHTARIFVGTNVAFRESTISEPGSQILSGDIEYRDVGSELVITPILGDSDMVTLEISQSISQSDPNSTGSNDTGQGTTQTILKSETETRVSVPDGYFLILSGQIQDQKQRRHAGLPCIGGLPIIGTAFSDKQELEDRDNLVIFVRPHLIRSKADMVRVTEDERTHYERVSDQRSYCMDRNEALELLNIVPPEPLMHDHYWDPCYDHDPCDVVCCD